MSNRICIVDDAEENRERIASIIKKNTDYEVFTAESGVDLLNLFKGIKEKSPDLILLDIIMPKMDGFEVAKLLKTSELGKEIPIIFVTALNDIENFKKAFEIGGVDYITKPFRKHELLARIDAQLNQKRLMDELKRQKDIVEEKKDELEKQNAILETSLEILSHDTKNIYSNIWALIHQNPDSPLLCMIEECVNELFELTMEAVGYIRSNKRILSIVEMIRNMKISKDRINISDHSRIKFYYSSYRLLFAEVSSLLKNAIANLIENALKYSPIDSVIEINLMYSNNNIIIKIIDHGIGIPDEEKDKIFQKYYRMNKNKNIEGSGRGLWITKNIIEAEKGTLSVEDNIGGGSIFTITLPCYRIDNLDEGIKNLSNWFNIPLSRIMEKVEMIKSIIQLEENIDDSIMDSAIFVNMLEYLRREYHNKNMNNIKEKLDLILNKNNDGKRILIVDDSLYVHYYLGSYFTELGFNVVGFAKDGKEGIEAYFKLKPDLITLDNTMPLMSGIEAAEELYKKDKTVRILFISAVGGSKNFHLTVKNIIPQHNYRVLEKPVEKTDIKEVLNNFL